MQQISHKQCKEMFVFHLHIDYLPIISWKPNTAKQSVQLHLKSCNVSWESYYAFSQMMKHFISVGSRAFSPKAGQETYELDLVDAF